jgi:ParB family transcriptional regulator, chromosome partitioning protein
MDNQRTVGKGLSSIIGAKSQNQQISGNLKTPYFPQKTGNQHAQIILIDPEKIKVNPYQPRKDFVESELKSLEESIKVHGIIQPLMVTSVLGGGYELIAGERRLRASKNIGLKKIPVIVRSAKELEKLELSLIENIQRHDLSPMEKAYAYKRMIDDFSLTHEDAAKKLGVSRPQFSNMIRLLTLPIDIQKGLASGKITMSQAKLMLEVRDEKKQEQIYKRVIQTNQTVGDTKKEVDRIKGKNNFQRKNNKDPQLLAWEEEMQSSLGTKVRIRERGRKGGVVEIEFYSEEDIESIVQKIINQKTA